jgi:hypothetical protein
MRRIDRIVATGAALLAAWLVLHFRLLEPHTGPLDARVLAVVDAVRRRSGSDAVNEARGRVAHALIQAPTSRWPPPLIAAAARVRHHLVGLLRAVLRGHGSLELRRPWERGG